MSGVRPKYPPVYFDTCIFFAHLKGEECHGVNCLPKIRSLIEECERGDRIIYTSALTFTEVLEARDPDEYARFAKIAAYPSLIVVAADKFVCESAGRIRSQLFTRVRDDGDEVSTTTPDSIHVASALWGECSLFYTLDKNHRATKSLGLLPLGELDFDGRKIAFAKPGDEPVNEGLFEGANLPEEPEEPSDSVDPDEDPDEHGLEPPPLDEEEERPEPPDEAELADTRTGV